MESKIYLFDQTKFSFFLNKTPKATIAFQNFLISYFEKFLFYKKFKNVINKEWKKNYSNFEKLFIVLQLK